MYPVSSSNWLEESTYDNHVNFIAGLARYHATLSGPYQTQIHQFIDASDWVGLAGLSIDHGIGNASELYHARQCRAFFEKFDGLRSEHDREATALRKFEEAEAVCLTVNKKWNSLMSLGGEQFPLSVGRVLIRAQRKVHECLGTFPKLQRLQAAFGPGANTSVKGSTSSARWKLNSHLVCSNKLAPVVSYWLREFPLLVNEHRKFSGHKLSEKSDEWAQDSYRALDDALFELPFHENGDANSSDGSLSQYDSLELLRRLEDHLDRCSVEVEVHPGNLMFVPKNYKTHRSIVVEPLLNSLLQKGVGSYIKQRLRRVGQDLSDQTRNQRLARVGSLNGHLATVDLSAASDTLSREFIRWMLTSPNGNYDWASRLDELRTTEVVYKGEVRSLQKWSSMGNGYTFELESLIFWALSEACCHYTGSSTEDLSVYGDDIIVPTDVYPLLKEVFEYCGFTINTEKSFVSGPFRESCGADYVAGIDIRPYYLKKMISGQTLFSLHNYYVRNFEFEAAKMVADAIHPSLHIFGPDGYGDGHLIGNWQPRRKLKHSVRGWEGGVFDTFSLGKVRLESRAQIGDRLYPTYSIYQSVSDPFDGSNRASDRYVVRGHKGYQRTSIYTLATGIFPRSNYRN